MARGKKTFLNPESYRDREAGWVIPSFARKTDLVAIESAIGRALTDVEEKRIQSLVHHAAARKRGSPKVTAQDVRATLRAIASMLPRGARQAFKKADGGSQAEIEYQILKHRPKRVSVRDAAAHALEAISTRTPAAGRRNANPLLSRQVLTLWRDMGSPGDLERFASEIFAATGEREIDLDAVASRLRRAGPA